MNQSEDQQCLADPTFSALWSACLDNPNDAGRKLIAADRAEELGFIPISRGLKFMDGTRWPRIGVGWLTEEYLPHWRNNVSEFEYAKLPFDAKYLRRHTSEVWLPLGYEIEHFHRLGLLLIDRDSVDY